MSFLKYGTTLWTLAAYSLLFGVLRSQALTSTLGLFQVTLEEVNSQIALEYGQAMTVRVCKMDGEVMPVVVVQNATVLDLKKAIQRYVQLRQEREGGIQHISWSYVWRTYHLTSAGEKLTDDRKKLRDYGIRNRDEVSFIKKLRQK